jgi:hypothetical protein
VGRGGFIGHESLTFEIPAKCEFMEFNGFGGILSLRISNENPFFVKEYPFVKSGDGRRLIHCYYRYDHKERILIKKEVEVIGSQCFSSIYPVQEVEFEANSNLKRIERKAFEGTKIRRIVIPSSVEVIEEEAFFGCKELVEVEFEGDLCEIGVNAFDFVRIESLKVGTLNEKHEVESRKATVPKQEVGEYEGAQI